MVNLELIKKILILTHDECQNIDRRIIKVAEHFSALDIEVYIIGLGSQDHDYTSKIKVYGAKKKFIESFNSNDSFWGITIKPVFRTKLRILVVRLAYLLLKSIKSINETFYLKLRSIYRKKSGIEEVRPTYQNSSQTIFKNLSDVDFLNLKNLNADDLKYENLPSLTSADFYPFQVTDCLLRKFEHIKTTFNLIIACDLPTLPAAIEIAARQKAYVVYDAHELYPFQKEFTYRQKLFMAYREAILFKSVDLCMTVSDRCVSFFKSTYNPDCSIICVNNSTEFELNNSKLFLRDKISANKNDIIFLYHGGFGEGRFLIELAKGFSALRRIDMHLVFLGSGALENKLKNIAQGSPNMHILGTVPQAELPSYICDSDAIVITYPALDQNTTFAFPNKLGDCIALSKPFLGNKEMLTLQDVSEKYKIGVAHAMSTIDDITKSFLAFEKWNASTKDIDNFSRIQAELGWSAQLKKMDYSLNSMFEKSPKSSRQSLKIKKDHH